MSGNDEYPSRDFGDSLKFTNWVLDSGATCHMIPHVSGVFTGLLEDIHTHIKVVDGYHIVAKQKGKF